MGSIAAALVFVLSLASGCRDDEPPAARLTASPSTVRLAHPETVAMTFEWTPLQPLRNPSMHPTVFVHLIDRPNHVVRTFDHELPGPWTVGVTRRDDFDLYQSALGPPMPAGSYTLTAGLYDPGLGYRWHLATDGPDVTGHREYRVASVQAVPGRPSGSFVRFSGDWSAVEPGGDKQVLQRRWLSGAGTLSIEPSPIARAIRVEIRVAASNAVVTATCPISARDLSVGARWIEVVPAVGQPCEIRMESPESSSPAAGASRWLAVEALAWRPRGS